MENQTPIVFNKTIIDKVYVFPYEEEFIPFEQDGFTIDFRNLIMTIGENIFLKVEDCGTHLETGKSVIITREEEILSISDLPPNYNLLLFGLSNRDISGQTELNVIHMILSDILILHEFDWFQSLFPQWDQNLKELIQYKQTMSKLKEMQDDIEANNE